MVWTFSFINESFSSFWAVQSRSPRVLPAFEFCLCHFKLNFLLLFFGSHFSVNPRARALSKTINSIKYEFTATKHVPTKSAKFDNVVLQLPSFASGYDPGFWVRIENVTVSSNNQTFMFGLSNMRHSYGLKNVNHTACYMIWSFKLSLSGENLLSDLFIKREPFVLNVNLIPFGNTELLCTAHFFHIYLCNTYRYCSRAGWKMEFFCRKKLGLNPPPLPLF